MLNDTSITIDSSQHKWDFSLSGVKKFITNKLFNHEYKSIVEGLQRALAIAMIILLGLIVAQVVVAAFPALLAAASTFTINALTVLCVGTGLFALSYIAALPVFAASKVMHGLVNLLDSGAEKAVQLASRIISSLKNFFSHTNQPKLVPIEVEDEHIEQDYEDVLNYHISGTNNPPLANSSAVADTIPTQQASEILLPSKGYFPSHVSNNIELIESDEPTSPGVPHVNPMCP